MIVVLWASSVVAVAGLLIAATAVARWWFVHRPGLWTEASRDVLIIAAHQDDCVIMAGEYALQAIAAGRRVQVMYLTNGDSQNMETDSPRARTRNSEAIDAWCSVGLAKDAIIFLSLPAAPVPGPSRLSPGHLAEAKERMEGIFSQLAEGAAVFIPAAVEAHIDHRSLRDLSLAALQSVGRPDLIVFEAAEYNEYVSLSRMPRRALLYILGAIPIISRWAGASRARGAAPAGFAYGGKPWMLPADTRRLEQKRQMLRRFASEDGELLVRHFGHQDLFRRVMLPLSADEQTPRWYLRVGGRRLGVSVLFSLAGVYASVFIGTAGLMRLIERCGAPLAVAFAVASIGGALWLCVWRRQSAERRLFYATAASGLIAGIIEGIV